MLRQGFEPWSLPWDGAKDADELPLMAVNAFDVMWFAWVGFYPETAVVSDADS